VLLPSGDEVVSDAVERR